MKRTLLVCDDEAPIRELLSSALGGRYEVLEAGDGEEALEQARQTRPDAILLDSLMPGLSGLEVLAELRRDPQLAGIPVIMMSGLTRRPDRAAASSAGADLYLPKPFSIAELGASIEALLGPADAPAG